MKTQHIIHLLQDNYYTIGIVFPEGEKVYTYKVPKSIAVETGDHCVVHVGGHRPEYKVVEVVEVHDVPDIDTDRNWVYKWIVQRVDTETYDATLEKEKEFQKHIRAMEREAARKRYVEQFKEQLGDDTLFNKAVGLLGEDK